MTALSMLFNMYARDNASPVFDRVGRAALGASASVKRASAEMVSAATAQAAAADKVAASEARLVAAADAEANAAGRVRIEQGRLTAAREKALGVPTAAAANQITAAEERLAAAERALVRTQAESLRAAERNTTAMQEQAAATSEAKLAAERNAVAQREAGVAAETAGARTQVAGRRTAVAAGEAEGASKKMHGMAAALGAVVAVDLGAHMVKMAGEFQQSTNVLVTAAGESTKNLKMVRRGILDIASSTGTKWQEVTAGMYLLEKAGYRGAAALQVEKAAAQGAREEGASLATVTQAMTSVMASYHMPASKAVTVMNEMKTAAGESKTTMEEFAGSLSTVLPLASANKISFADIGGALASLTQHGTSANEATQELAFAIRGLSAPNMVAQKEMAQLGINSNDVSQQLGKRGLAGTLDYLSTTVLHRMGPSGKILLATFNASKVAAMDATRMFSAMSPASQKMAQDFLHGSINLKTWNADIKYSTPVQANLMKQWAATTNSAHGFQQALKNGVSGSQTYSDAMKKMTGGANGLNVALQLGGESQKGTAERIARIAAAGRGAGKDVSGWASTQKLFNVQMDMFKQRLEAAAIGIGSALLPAVSKVVGGLSKMVDFLSRNSAVIKPILAVLGGMAAAIMAIVTATKLWALAQAAVDAVMAANPIGIVVVALAGLAAGLIYAYKHSETFRKAVARVVDGFKAFVDIFKKADAGGGVAGFFKSITTVIGHAWGDISGALSKLGKAFWSWIKDAVTPAVQWLGRWALAVGRWIVQTGVPAVGAAAVHLGKALWSWVKDAVPTALAQLGRWAKVIGSWLVGTGLPAVGHAMARFGDVMWNWVKAAVPAAVREVGNLIGKVASWVTGTGLPLLGAGLGKMGSALWSWVSPQIPKLLGHLGTLLGRTAAWIIGTGMPVLVVALVKMSYKLTTWVLPRLPGLLLAFAKLIGEVVKRVATSGIPMLAHGFVKVGAGIIDVIAWSITHGLPVLVKGIAALAPTLIKGMGALAKGAVSGFASEFARSKLGQLFGHAFAPVAGAAAGVYKSVTGWFRRMGKDVSSVVGGIAGGVKAGWDKVSAVTSGVLNGIGGFVRKHWRLLLAIATGGLGLIYVVIQDHWHQISGVFSSIYHDVTGWVSRMWHKVVGYYNALASGVASVVGHIHDAEVSAWNAVYGAVSGVAKRLWRSVSGFFTNLANDIAGIAKGIYNREANTWSSIYGTVSGWAKNLWHKVAGFFTNLAGDVASIAKGIYNRAAATWTNIYNTVTGWAKNLWRKVAGFFTSMASAVGGTVDKMRAAVAGFFSRMYTNATNTAKNVWTRVTNFFSSMSSDVQRAFSDMVAGVKGTWDTIMGIVKAPISFIVNTAYNHGIRPVWNAVAGVLHEGGMRLPALRFAMGGVIPGNHDRDTVPFLGTPGEVVVPKHVVKNFGGPESLMSKLGFSGGGGPTHYGLGGIIHGVGHGIGAVGHGIGSVAGTVAGAVGSAAGAVVGVAKSVANDLAHMVRGAMAAAVAPAIHGVERVADHVLGRMGGAGALMDSGVHNIGDRIISWVKGDDSKNAAVAGNVSMAGAAPGSSAGAAQAYARSQMGRFGWSASQMGPLIALWNHESGWNYRASNGGGGPDSGRAYGIPQSLPGSKMASSGSDWRTNPATQINWGLNYIKSRYGSPAHAWAFEMSHTPNWYDQGGIASGKGFMPKNTLKPERVLSGKQTESFDRLVALLERNSTPSTGRVGPLVHVENVNSQVDLESFARQADFKQRMGSY